MKPALFVISLSLSIMFQSVPSALSKNSPCSAEQLRTDFEAALKTKNTHAVLVLFNWDGVPANLRFKLDEETAELFNHESITAVKLTALTTNWMAS
jgi:hypothetical protein